MAGLSVANLSEMRDKVKSWGDREDLSDGLIDDFINIAVQRAVRKTEASGLLTTVTLTSVLDGVFQLPSDYGRTEAVEYTYQTTKYPLERADPTLVNLVSSVDTANAPSYFSTVFDTEFTPYSGDFLQIGPATAAGDTVSFSYYRELQTLSNDTDTNWYITDGTTAVLYASLKELSVYVSDDEAAASWDTQFMNALAEIQDNSDKEKWGGSPLSIKL
tara:strand:- start:30407 stop:31057 length:651 start_codon:yes stop_codon:yes gene_type:complete